MAGLCSMAWSIRVLRRYVLPLQLFRPLVGQRPGIRRHLGAGFTQPSLDGGRLELVLSWISWACKA